MTARSSLDSHKKDYLHPLTVTAGFQPFPQLVDTFKETSLFGDRTGFLDAPSFIPSGSMFQWISDDDELWTLSSIIQVRG